MSKKISFGTNPRNNKKVEELMDQWVSKGSLEQSKNVSQISDDSTSLTRFTIDIPSELHRKIKSFCALKGVKMKEEIQVLLENHFTE
jgi:polyhydroxyalkanoate synthesis regulator phasin